MDNFFDFVSPNYRYILVELFNIFGKVKAMPDTMVTESEPLVATKDFPDKTNTTQGTSTIENEQIITIDDLAAHKQKLLMKKILILVIVVNLIVLISIILTT